MTARLAQLLREARKWIIEEWAGEMCRPSEPPEWWPKCERCGAPMTWSRDAYTCPCEEKTMDPIVRMRIEALEARLDAVEETMDGALERPDRDHDGISELEDRHNRHASPEYQARVKAPMEWEAKAYALGTKGEVIRNPAGGWDAWGECDDHLGYYPTLAEAKAAVEAALREDEP